MPPKRKAAHHRGPHDRLAKLVTTAAYANPSTRCRRCRLTLAEFRAQHPGRNWRWTAGHVIDGQVGGPYAPEHGYCNSSAGATKGNKQRTQSAKSLAAYRRLARRSPARARRTDLTW